MIEELKARLEKLRDEMSGEYECATQHPERKWDENDYKYRDFQAGFDAAMPIIEELVGALEGANDLLHIPDHHWEQAEYDKRDEVRAALKKLGEG